MDYLNHLLFGWYPYIALTVFLLGSLLRYDHAQYTWRAGSTEIFRKRSLMIGSNLFHVGILIIFFGHLVGLLTPIQLFETLGVSHGAKQSLAIIVGGLAGLSCLAGAIILANRRFYDPRVRANSTFADDAILVMLIAQVSLGLLTIIISLQNLDGHEMVKFMTWAQGILTLQADAWKQVADVPLIFKAHLLLGMTIFLVAPFTRLVHIWSAPIWYFGRRGYQIVRTRRT